MVVIVNFPAEMVSKFSKFTSSVKKKFRTFKKSLKVAKAGATLVGKTFVYSPAIVTRALRGRGLVYPTSKYIGPGNKLDEGKPVDAADALAYVHDHQYSELLQKGKSPYFTFNEADREMLRNVDVTTDKGLAEYLGISAKRIFKSDRTPVSKVDPWAVKYGPNRARSLTAAKRRKKGSKKR